MRHRVFVDLLDVARNALSGRRRVLRLEVARAADRLRAQPRHRQGRRRGRRVRAVHGRPRYRAAGRASPPTTRTTSAPPWRFATGWSRIGRTTCHGGAAQLEPEPRHRRARRAGRSAPRVRRRTRRSTCWATCSATGGGNGGRTSRRKLAKLPAGHRRPARRPGGVAGLELVGLQSSGPGKGSRITPGDAFRLPDPGSSTTSARR